MYRVSSNGALVGTCSVVFNHKWGGFFIKHRINDCFFFPTRQTPAAERVSGADQEHAGPGQPLRVDPEGRKLVAPLRLPGVGRRRGGIPDGPQLRRRPP